MRWLICDVMVLVNSARGEIRRLHYVYSTRYIQVLLRTTYRPYHCQTDEHSPRGGEGSTIHARERDRNPNDSGVPLASVFLTKEDLMKRTGYIVWVNDRQYWHRSLATAQQRADDARKSRKDVVIGNLTARHIIYPLQGGRPAVK